MRYQDRTQLLKPEGLAFESGVERLEDGVVHVAVLTSMPGVRAEMIAWWFGTYMQTTEHYKRWHPRDHVWMDWEDKSPGTHLGAQHLVHEYIGGKLQKLRISFVDPVEVLGAQACEPGRLFVCAKAGLLERPDVKLARMIHAAYDTSWGCELRSHFWMGHFETPRLGGLLQAVGNTRPARRLAASLTDARALEVHCHEEMTFLGRFLPGLYAEHH